MKKLYLLLLLALQTSAGYVMAQSVGINATGALPDPKAMLDISSTSSGLLIPRMTTAQRDAISSPPEGLQVFNLTTNSLNLYRSGHWEAVTMTSPATNLVYVHALADLPAPSGNAITLDATKMYVFSGIVNISPNYLNLNGASLRGNDPGKDGVLSMVSGAVLRSTGVSVYMENLLVLPASAGTKAYDFADATGSKYCNLFPGCSVVDAGTPSLGVGQVGGFHAVTISHNYWNCKDGIKVTGNVGKFASLTNFITGISAGSGIEFMSGLVINDIDLSNNYFVYSGQTGVKVNNGSTIDRGRMTTNMFRGVTTPLSGFSGATPEWEMKQNSDGVMDTHAQAFLYMNDNTTPTGFGSTNNYYKIAGTTTLIRSQKFTATNNQVKYIGKMPTSVEITAVVGGKAPQAGADYFIVLAKNGITIPTPAASMGSMVNGQGFQIVLASDVDLVTGDYLEIGIRNNANTNSVVISDLQFRVSE
jgi:hypothetical protein